MVVYKTTNLVNGKIYVGKTHRKDGFDRYLGSGKVFRQAMRKYGRENFKREIIEECETREDLDIAESKWIELLHARDPDIGYNLAPGGEGGGAYEGLTPEQREIRNRKISETTKGKPKRGHAVSEETRVHMQQAQQKKAQDPEYINSRKGVKLSSTTIEKMSAAKKGKPRCGGKDWTGLHLSEETKAKIRAARIGMKQSPETVQKRKETIRRNKEKRAKEAQQ